jgi:hypothetical protein
MWAGPGKEVLQPKKPFASGNTDKFLSFFLTRLKEKSVDKMKSVVFYFALLL